MIAKGNKYIIEEGQVNYTKKKGEGVNYWRYEYNLQNRLSKVYKNQELIAEFIYDANGKRIKSRKHTPEGTEETNFVYSFKGQVLVEDDLAQGKYTSFIYAFSKKFAKVKGVVTESTEIVYYHHNNLGSTRAMTDKEGNVVMDQDYLPFGGDLPKPGQIEVKNETGESYKYTGQKEVASIGLYYYNARYYDPSIGRFNRQDSYRGELDDPQSQHLYVYVLNNPLKYTDPTGNMSEETYQKILNEEFVQPMKSGFEYLTSWEGMKDSITGIFGGNNKKEKFDTSKKYSKTLLGTDNNKDNPDDLVRMNMGKGEIEYYDLGGRTRVAGVDTNFKTVQWGNSDSPTELKFSIDATEGVIEEGLGVEVTEGHKNLDIIDRGIHGAAGAYGTAWEGGINVKLRISDVNIKGRLYGTALGGGVYLHSGANYKDSGGNYHYLEGTGVIEKYLDIKVNFDIYSEKNKATSKE